MECDECGSEMAYEPKTMLWMCPNCGHYCYMDDWEDEDPDGEWKDIYISRDPEPDH